MSTSLSSEQSLQLYPGRRISYDGALCTVRYCGSLPGTKGIWLGVEWDAPGRGKHDGIFQGKRYFECLSSAPTAGSFVRPSRTPDPRRAFLEALRFKYVGQGSEGSKFPKANKHPELPSLKNDVIEISGKVVEEVGFDRIRKQQAVLRDLRIVLLDELCLAGVTVDQNDAISVAAAQEAIRQTCPDLVELDLGWNPIETWADIAAISLPLRKLRILKTSGLRFREFDFPHEVEIQQPFQHVIELQIGENLLRPAQILTLLGSQTASVLRFPSLKVLSLGQNDLSFFQPAFRLHTGPKMTTVTTLILDNNLFTSLVSALDVLSVFPNLKVISLQRNKISHIGFSGNLNAGNGPPRFPQLETLSLSQNLISDYSFIDALPLLFPNLTSLRVSNNPLFTTSIASNASIDPRLPDEERSSLLSATNKKAGPGAFRSDAAYSLTLARIPTLSILNHSSITTRDREEGEIYYISVAERDLSASLAKVSLNTEVQGSATDLLKTRYPRYEELCRKYDRDSMFVTFLQQKEVLASQTKAGSNQPTYAPGTLGARLIKAHFHISRPKATSSHSHDKSQNTDPSPSNPPLQEFSRLIPRTIDAYRLKALLAREFALPALQFKLIYESEELDPVKDEGSESASWETWGGWNLDSPPDDGAVKQEGNKWKRREVEIVDGTREWGFYVDDRVREVSVRVEPFEREKGPPGKRKS